MKTYTKTEEIEGRVMQGLVDAGKLIILDCDNLASDIEAPEVLSSCLEAPEVMMPITFPATDEGTNDDLMPVAEAMRYADLWAAGKMIGGDIDGVCLSLRAEILRLRAALEAQWLVAHDEHCTNMRDCTAFGGVKPCQHPRP